MPLLLALAAVTVSPEAMATRYRELTAAEKKCVVDPGSTDITVCGMREADRYRVPFVGPEPGSRADQNVPLERVTLLRKTTPVQDMGPFLVGGGHVGVTVSTRGGVRAGQARTLAP